MLENKWIVLVMSGPCVIKCLEIKLNRIFTRCHCNPFFARNPFRILYISDQNVRTEHKIYL